MTTPKTPETPDPETIIELVDHINPLYLIVAFLAGAAIVAGIVYVMGRDAIGESPSND